MSEIVDEPSPLVLATAVEANTVAWLTHYSRVPGGELHQEPYLVWYFTGRPSLLLNGVARAQLPAGDPEQIRAAIAAALAPFRSRRVPMSWWTGPSTRPTDLGIHLQACGLRRAFDAPGMAADLGALPEPAARVSGLTVRRVLTPADLEVWLDAGQRRASPERVRASSREANVTLALDPNGSLRHYLGVLDGRPVAKSTLFLGAGLAGIYGVLVHPDFWRRGIGTAMTVSPLCEARAQGYRIGVLASSAMALALYRRLGFREYTRIGMYVDDPSHSAAT